MFKQDIAEMEGVFLVVFPLLFNISGIQRAILKLILSYIRGPWLLTVAVSIVRRPVNGKTANNEKHSAILI